jgi:hypothetical protein
MLQTAKQCALKSMSFPQHSRQPEDPRTGKQFKTCLPASTSPVTALGVWKYNLKLLESPEYSRSSELTTRGSGGSELEARTPKIKNRQVGKLKSNQWTFGQPYRHHLHRSPPPSRATKRTLRPLVLAVALSLPDANTAHLPARAKHGHVPQCQRCPK